ncbi:OsmC family protein [Rheinheimera sp.]|uniref:OsmC family protein n=1 Tax=Rheinheimera sp. TaxID=1869214 RepID=UPI002735833F|nr:OsmC family protein [Rheinheimera sp.]MDP2716710.1 OsmC family protein [Rheinheimera sp.]
MSIELRKSDSGIYRQTIRINQHTVFADVAKDLGGDNSAPDPHDYYDAALAACKAITVMMYAKRKQLPLDYIDVVIERDNSREAQGVYVLNVQLKLLGSLTDEQKSQLTTIAGKCPIHKLMTEVSTEINTSYS